MNYYPVFLNINKKKCLVVGGGRVAERRIKELVKCNAVLVITARNISSGIMRLVKKNPSMRIVKSYNRKLLRGAALVIIATDDLMLNRRVSEDARQNRVPVNRADNLEECDFIVPSVMRRGDLAIAITTGGASPRLTSLIRRMLQAEFGPEYGILTKRLKRQREALKNHSRIFSRLNLRRDLVRKG